MYLVLKFKFNFINEFFQFIIKIYQFFSFIIFKNSQIIKSVVNISILNLKYLKPLSINFIIIK